MMGLAEMISSELRLIMTNKPGKIGVGLSRWHVFVSLFASAGVMGSGLADKGEGSDQQKSGVGLAGRCR